MIRFTWLAFVSFLLAGLACWCAAECRTQAAVELADPTRSGD